MIRKTNGILEEYKRQIDAGEIVAGIELIMELGNLLEDMEDERFIYDTTEADRRIGFIEGCLRLTKSPFYGKPFRLMLWQKAFISAVYGFKMADSGLDRFRTVMLFLSRKGGKSELCSALLLTDFFIGGEGRDIVCSSNDDTQADILYMACDTMRQMVDPHNIDSWRNQKGLRCLINNNRIFKISEKVKNKEGRNIDFSVSDELHELHDGVIVNSIIQSMSLKPNPKLIMITTEGFVEDGFLSKQLVTMRRIINREVEDENTIRTLPFLYTQDSESEVWDGNEDNRLWMKSNPSLGVVKRYDYLRQQIARAKESSEDRAFVLTKDFNIPQSTATAWLLSEDYSYDLPFDPEEFRGAIAVSGTDIAETTDLCSNTLIIRRPNDPVKYIMQMYWIPQTKLTDKFDDSSAGARYRDWQRDGLVRVDDANYVDTTLMADWFAELYRKYGIRLYKAGYDVKFSHDWEQRMEEYGFSTEIVYQRPEVLSTASLKLDAKGYGMLVKAGGTDSRRIDGAVSLVIAYEMYRRYMTDIESTL